jgi:phosphomannomutase
MKVSELRATYPEYVIAKNKIELSDNALIDSILNKVKEAFADEDINTIDGVKISFESRKEWIHLRRSNTEPIIRIYAEAATKEEADALAQKVIDIADSLM